MTRFKKHSVIWTICYAIDTPEDPEDDFFTGTWFAYGRSKEEAAQNFLNEKRGEAEYCGGIPVERYTVVNVVEGFSC